MYLLFLISMLLGVLVVHIGLFSLVRSCRSQLGSWPRLLPRPLSRDVKENLFTRYRITLGQKCPGEVKTDPSHKSLTQERPMFRPTAPSDQN